MKKGAFIVFFCLSAFLAASVAVAGETPRRPATVVDDVMEPYTADEWIISPDEEPGDDQETEDYPACDINGIIACSDETYLRIDILVNSEIEPDRPLFFAVRFAYEGMNEYYTYYSDAEKLVYEKEKGGKIVQTKVLTEAQTDDTAGITDSPDLDNADVYFIINKADHIGGVKGRSYYLTCSFFSGYLDVDNQLAIADETIPVDLQFTF